MQTISPLPSTGGFWPLAWAKAARCGSSTGTAARARKSRRFNSGMATIEPQLPESNFQSQEVGIWELVVGSLPVFERYTERARRVLFFARYEASQLGSIAIETEHLLLGLIREGKGLTSRIFARSHLSLENIRKDIEGRTVFREKVSTSVEIPFSAETKRVLGFAAEEADRLLHNYIGTEHLLL